MTADPRTALRVHSLYREVRDWVGRQENQAFMSSEPRERLAEALNGAAVKLGVVMTRLAFLAKWHAACAVVAAWEGRDPRTDLRVAHRADLQRVACAMVAARARPQRSTQAPLSTDQYALHAARALACNLLEDARYICDALGSRELFRAPEGVVVGYVLALRQLLDGGTVSGTGYGPYSQLLASMVGGDVAGFRQAIEQVCDFRLSRVAESTDKVFYEFSDPVYAVYPAELVAAARVCESYGHSLIGVTHPLMTSPSAVMMDLRDVKEDSLLVEVDRWIAAH